MDLLFNVLFTVTIYCLPIVILRYLILRRAVSKKAAICITIIYCVIAWISFRFIQYAVSGEITSTTTTAFLWGMIDYSMLREKPNNKDKNNTLNKD